MRKITQQSVNAFEAFKPFKSGNTEVRQHATDPDIWCLILHGNHIAQHHQSTGAVWIQTCGWQSNTTKERLNGIPGVSIHQKNHQWFLNDKPWDGEATQIRG